MARLALALSLLVLAASAARADDPAAKGSFATRSERFAITVGGRGTTIDVRLPAAASFARPTVLICHGWSYSIANYESIAEHLASRGFAAVLYAQPDIFGTDTQTWANQMRDAITAVIDLGANPKSSIFGEIDAARIGVLGHSYGGACVTMLAGQDARVRCAVALAPVNQWHRSAVLSSAAKITAPFLVIGGTADLLAWTGVYTRPFSEAATRASAREYVEVSGGGHMMFLDRGSLEQLTSRYYTAWLERFLEGKSDPGGWTDGTEAAREMQRGILSTAEHAEPGAAKPASSAPKSAAPTVAQVQQRLAALGYYQDAVDGIFGPHTKAAVQAFQSAHGLVADGIVGPLTRAALGI